MFYVIGVLVYVYIIILVYFIILNDHVQDTRVTCQHKYTALPILNIFYTRTLYNILQICKFAYEYAYLLQYCVFNNMCYD